MNGMMCDASCPKCGKRFGWAGLPKARPPCPRCGHQVDAAVIAHDQAEVEKGREMALAEGPRTSSGRTEAVWLQDWEPGTYVYVGRKHPSFPGEPGTFGNPFSPNPKARALFVVGTVDDAVEHYRRWLEGEPSVAELLPPAEAVRRLDILAALPSLRGKRLGCFQHDGPCHAAVLAELADGPLGEPVAGASASSAGRIRTTSEAAQAVVRAVRRHRYRFETEKDLQHALEAVIEETGLAFVREAPLGDGDIIDFLVAGSVGVEVKIGGGLSDVTRQLHRYAGHDAVLALVLVTSLSRLDRMPAALRGKPVYVATVSGAFQ